MTKNELKKLIKECIAESLTPGKYFVTKNKSGQTILTTSMKRLPNAVELDTRHVVELFKKYPDVRNTDFTSKPYVIGTNPKFDAELKSVIEFAAANR